MLEEELEQEIDKWTQRIHVKRKTVVVLDQAQEHLLNNIDAYIADSKHFLEKKDMIRSFEALVWAWSWIEILEELGVLMSKTGTHAE
ncbi:MAG: DUF357 domain-containing protein [Candidatus Aenigmarchaeota archaeon]|nr:DUF357 domain-containing protein [Candidatus Aenigmarchaeota archaeon]